MALLMELAVAGALMGTMIGAGFASGQELVQFFLTLGTGAPAAVVLMTGLLMTSSFLVRHLALKWRTASYRDLMIMLLGNWYRPADVAITAFLFGGLAIMLAGAGAVARQYFGWPPLAGILACSGLALLGSLGRGRGVLILNSLLVPVMLGIIVLIVGLNWPPTAGPLTTVPAGPLVGSNWVLNACLYVTYNMVGLMVLLASLPNSRRGTAGAALGGLLLGILVFVLVQALGRLPKEILVTELPLLSLVKSRHPELQGAYALSLWLAMVTTAASNLYGLAERLGSSSRLPLPAAVPVLVLAVPMASFGFANLVGLIYPFFGYLGLLLLILVMGRRLLLFLRF
ncbi:hypothetical protein MTAT_16070 [Moorella thermoacetica]|uniref:Uncharacterized protein n=1 Tax=Neomoorella thermoacetica TaxID=1525 RepID=A0AAC9HKD9_NEOTH|nr:hypothetical protein [Moorella thermoacetica]AOQ25480.1 hypothetical protein Maut_03076 [Moorella thermoacetica]TYL13269.1 hypothetical protein MTAT_16070 [Moorella thermoacetica]